MSGSLQQGLALIDGLGSCGELDAYHLYHSARADLLRRMGRNREALESYHRGLALHHQCRGSSLPPPPHIRTRPARAAWSNRPRKPKLEAKGTGRVGHVRLTRPGLPWGVHGPKTMGAAPRWLSPNRLENPR